LKDHKRNAKIKASSKAFIEYIRKTSTNEDGECADLPGSLSQEQRKKAASRIFYLYRYE